MEWDRISIVPSDILCRIGCFLSAKEAALTAVLSKRWRNLFTIIPKLHFDDDGSDKDGEGLKDFLDGVLALPLSTRVREFSLKCNHVSQYDDHINRCLCDVVKRGVLVLKLKIEAVEGEEGSYSLPLEVFTCKTVSTMELGSGFAIHSLPTDAFLPALKTFRLYSVRFCDSGGRCAFETLLSASPVLVELVLEGLEWERWKWSCTVSSPTLERLTIYRAEWFPDDDSIRLDCRGLAYDFDSISLDTPGLTYLFYYDYVPKVYPIVNLNSLVEAELGFRVAENGSWHGEHANIFNPMNLIQGLKFVENLVLYRATMDDSLLCSYHYGDEYLCGCVSEFSSLLSCPLEVLKIEHYGGSIEELKLMERLLGILTSLELVEVHGHVSDDERLQVTADLLMLPRASSKCKIQVLFR